jgi:hypothetical protein
MRVLPIAALVAAAFASASLPASADQAGTVQGALTLDDRPTPLTHAYVVEINELPEMQFGEGPARYLKLLLTDRPFPEGRRPSDMAAHQLAFEGALRGVGLDINAETGEVMSGRTLLPQAEGPQFFTVVTMNTEPMVVLEDWAEADGRLHGHVRTSEPMEVVNFDGDPNLPATFAFDATFDAAIIAAPKLVETLEGDQARQGPHAAAVQRFMEAIASKDLAAIKDAVATGDPMRDQLTAEDVEMMHGMMLEGGQRQPADLIALLTKVYVFDNESAVVVLRHGETETSTFPLKQDNGTWKMGQP